MHNGKAKMGLQLPQTKPTMRYSKAAMRPEMRERAEALLADPNFLSNRENIALHDAAIMEILEGMERGESGKLWELCNQEWDALQNATDNAEKAKHLNEAGRLIKRGYRDHMARRELMEHHVVRAKLTEAESKLLERHQASVNAAQLMALIQKLGEAIVERISDEREQNALLGDLYTFVPVGANTRGG